MATASRAAKTLAPPATLRRGSTLPGNVTIAQQFEKYAASFVGSRDVDLFDQSIDEVSGDVTSTFARLKLMMMQVQDNMVGRYVTVFSRPMSNSLDNSFTEAHVPHMGRSIVVHPVKRRERQEEDMDLDELSSEYEQELRTADIHFPGGKVALEIDNYSTTRHYEATCHMEDNDFKYQTDTTSILDQVLTDFLLATNHSIAFGSKCTDCTYLPDFSQDLDSIDEDWSSSFYSTYQVPSSLRDTVTTNFGFHFLQLRLQIQADEGRPLPWLIVAVKIEEDVLDEFEGHSVYWPTRMGKVIVMKDGSINGPLLRQEIRTIGQLDQARRKFERWKKKEKSKAGVAETPRARMNRKYIGKGLGKTKTVMMRFKRRREQDEREETEEVVRDGTMSPPKRSRSS